MDEANQHVVKGVGYNSRKSAYQNSIILLARVTTIAFGAWLIIQGEITLGTLIAFLGFIRGFFGPVQNLTGNYKTYQIATVSLEHIFAILDKQDFLGDNGDAIELETVKGEVIFDHVQFRYPTAKKPTIRDFDLKVKPGESIAFVAPAVQGSPPLLHCSSAFMILMRTKFFSMIST